MNKVTKGALAAAAGAAILVGGAGTMAAWSDTSDLGSGTVTAGTLNINQVGQGAWIWANGDNEGNSFDPESDLLVPGDSVAYLGTYDITLSGTNLAAELKANLGGVTGDLKDLNALTVTAVGGGTTPVTQSETGKKIGTQITFNESAGNDTQGKGASLAGATITLTQVAPTTTP